MDGLWTELAKQVPALVVLVLLVYMFSKTITKIADSFLSHVDKKNAYLEKMDERTVSVIEKNTEISQEVKSVLSEVKTKLTK